jgi:glucose-6-phosphate 1-dehydrogenase
LLQYIDGDHQNPKTFQKLNKALGEARSPVHYLAIPPDLFGSVVQALGKSNYAANARVLVEKPFGRDLASAGPEEADRLAADVGGWREPAP